MTCGRAIRLGLLLVLATGWRLDAGGAATDDRRGRAARLENAILAPCCYTEPISRHQSEIAVKMRVEVQSLVNAGKTDEEILALYEARYGTRVLVPPQREVWVWSDGVPWLLMVLGAAGVVWLVMRWRVFTMVATPRAAGNLPDVPESDEDWERLDSSGPPPPRS